MNIRINIDGSDVELTLTQLLMFQALDEDLEIDGWHLCDNGCCVLVHEKGLDETAWRISSDGVVQKIDHYGNIIYTA